MNERLAVDQIADWPLYINDAGEVSCAVYEGTCDLSPGNDAWTPSEAGRRTTFGGLMKAMERHMSEDHGVTRPSAATRAAVPPDEDWCPKCGVPPEEPCRTKSGRISGGDHAGRRRLLARANA